MQLESRKLAEEKMNDNQSGEEEKVDFTVVTCHVPLLKSYTVGQLDFDIIFVFLCNIVVFWPSKTEENVQFKL